MIPSWVRLREADSISCGMHVDRVMVSWLQGQQGASLQLTARLQAELTSFNPTLAINNGDISYARHATTVQALIAETCRNFCVQYRSSPPALLRLCSPALKTVCAVRRGFVTQWDVYFGELSPCALCVNHTSIGRDT